MPSQDAVHALVEKVVTRLFDMPPEKKAAYILRAAGVTQENIIDMMKLSKIDHGVLNKISIAIRDLERGQ